MAIDAGPHANLLIVERERELATLNQAVEDARNGLPSVVLVVGEPGLGKSHLLRSLRNRVGSSCLNGYSLEADAPPYFPFARALARLGRDLPPSVPAPAVSILSNARIISSGVATNGQPADGLTIADALTEVVVSLASESPVVLVLDDMQWASSAAWEAVTYLARAADSARISVVLASRPEAIQHPSPGATALTELNRNGLLRLVHLRPLSAEGIATITAHSLGGQPSPTFLSALETRTGGNPFFLEEVLRSLTEAGQVISTPAGLDLGGGSRVPIALPDTLRLAIWQRVSRLPASTVDALQAGATLGRVFDLSLLSVMLDQPAEWVTGRLRPAARAGVVAEESAGRWSFVHDALREAISDQVGERRQELHRLAAKALSGLGSAASDLQTAAAIARHLRQSGDAAAAVVACLHASSLALAGHAAEQAVELAVAAEDLYHAEYSLPPHLSARDVRQALARALTAAADYERAEAAWSSVLDLTGDRADRARVLVDLATAARKAERSDAAAAYFERALDLLQDGNDVRTLTEALVELATLEGTTRSEYDAAIQRGERALNLAREAGDPGLEARAALALANARARGETPTTSRPLLSLSLDLALQGDDLVVAAEAAASLSNSFYWTGELRSALAYAERRLDIAERGRDAFALRHAYTWLALLATTAGDWDRAHEMVRLAEPSIARMGSPEPLGFLRLVEGLLALRTGEIDLALTRTEEAMRVLTPLGDATISWYVAVRIWALIAAGRTQEAAEECRAQEQRLLSMPENALPARSSRCGLGRAYVALGDLVRASDCEQKLAPFVDDFHWRPARLTLAALAALRGVRDESLRLLREVEEFAARDGLLFDLEDVRRIITALEAGAPPEVAFARPDARLLSKSAKPSAGGLSPRELEVLQLVAMGLSNREIGEKLVISERTVVNHVSHIFEKVAVENRAGATAYAFRSGLVDRI